jgi:hypothetical protein
MIRVALQRIEDALRERRIRRIRRKMKAQKEWPKRQELYYRACEEAAARSPQQIARMNARYAAMEDD